MKVKIDMRDPAALSRVWVDGVEQHVSSVLVYVDVNERRPHVLLDYPVESVDVEGDAEVIERSDNFPAPPRTRD